MPPSTHNWSESWPLGFHDAGDQSVEQVGGETADTPEIAADGERAVGTLDSVTIEGMLRVDWLGEPPPT